MRALRTRARARTARIRSRVAGGHRRSHDDRVVAEHRVRGVDDPHRFRVPPATSTMRSACLHRPGRPARRCGPRRRGATDRQRRRRAVACGVAATRAAWHGSVTRGAGSRQRGCQGVDVGVGRPGVARSAQRCGGVLPRRPSRCDGAREHAIGEQPRAGRRRVLRRPGAPRSGCRWAARRRRRAAPARATPASRQPPPDCQRAIGDAACDCRRTRGFQFEHGLGPAGACGRSPPRRRTGRLPATGRRLSAGAPKRSRAEMSRPDGREPDPPRAA